jgi:iron only hydrogenase large subunit-like protein/nitrogen-specific signal transduction histidine kinase
MADFAENNALIYTIKDRCRRCYTCVRECPAKAIKIEGGQAEVITERCIACGNCTIVCSQGAKAYLRETDKVKNLLKATNKTVALIAPSFPAEFPEVTDHRQLVGMVKALGFEYVVEVAFGADLVAREYRKFYTNTENRSFISSDCPAVVNYIRLYYPDLTQFLVPIVPPMLAVTRVVKERYGNNVQSVFIGPCVAKKIETEELSAVITFTELRQLFEEQKIEAQNISPCEFDPPKAGKGAIFPVSRGLVESAGVDDNIIYGNVVIAEGRVDFQEALKEFDAGIIQNQHLELLCCNGCIMGPGMSKGGKLYSRKAFVSAYVRNKKMTFNRELWQQELDSFNDIKLSCSFNDQDDQRIVKPPDEDIAEVLKSMGKVTELDHLNCGACGYDSCTDHAVAVIKGLAEAEMCLPFAIEQLRKSISELEISNTKLYNAQMALKQSEKLAHMGQLSAGIAHELNNPLGVIIMYSNILLDECKEDVQFRNDLQLIVEQAARCKKIVSGLLNFARKTQVNYSEVNIIELIDMSLQSVIIPEKIVIKKEIELANPISTLDSEQMIQVLTNLIKNAIEAMPGGGSLTIKSTDSVDEIHFKIADTGMGIKEEYLAKVFEPFFTTKGIGKGTGLGLATAYGVVKMHKGSIKVSSNTNAAKGSTGTTFKIAIPRTPA